MPSTVRHVNLFSQSGLNLSTGTDTIPKIFQDADMSRAGKFFVILVIWIFGFGWPSSALALNQILNIRHWVAPDHTRVVIDTSEDVSFTVEKGEKMIAVDLEETSLPPHLPRCNRPEKAGGGGDCPFLPSAFRGARGTLLPRSGPDHGFQIENISGQAVPDRCGSQSCRTPRSRRVRHGNGSRSRARPGSS